MNWRNLFSDVKNIFKRLDRIALLNTIKAKAKNQGNGFIYLNRNTSLQLAPAAVLLIENQAYFYFNEYWHQPDPFPGMLGVHTGGVMQVTGNFTIYSGARLVVNENARLVLGSGYINHGLNLNCFKSIEIGRDVAISENVTIRDSDNHGMKAAGYKGTLPIKIGDHVWIGMNVTILKGVTIGDGAIIAAGAVVNKNIPARCLAAGVPARVLKENVEWH
ncbi:acetyltransferase [Adhaeribacter aerolatus]|uniref:Acetyltransferase n=1 Tax=Adhaeribacter aerolatus TaxID=670289 RepID=A0A512AZ03_9BACT|nr:acyltransferase [Adhaeribacter aerolatus]GEO04930.1 acetyltransferase [Adhaeribacter aerolatus]